MIIKATLNALYIYAVGFAIAIAVGFLIKVLHAMLHYMEKHSRGNQ